MNIKLKLLKLIDFYCKPRMISGYKNASGELLKRVRISSSTFIDTPQKLEIEDNVFIGHYNFIEASNGVKIGEGCQLTNFISVTSHSSHISIRLYGNKYCDYTEHKGYVKGSVEIGRYVFIGPHSVIMPGTVIGKGSIVAAFSYVKGKFPDFSIIKGNPAIVVGDTRKIDEKFLEENPELIEFYKKWSE